MADGEFALKLGDGGWMLCCGVCAQFAYDPDPGIAGVKIRHANGCPESGKAGTGQQWDNYGYWYDSEEKARRDFRPEMPHPNVE